MIEQKETQALTTQEIQHVQYMAVYTQEDTVYLFRVEELKVLIDLLLHPILHGNDPMMELMRLGIKGLLKPHVRKIVDRIYDTLLHRPLPDIPRKSDPLVVLTDTAKLVLIHYLTLHTWELKHEHVDTRDGIRFHEVRSITPYAPSQTDEGDRRESDK